MPDFRTIVNCLAALTVALMALGCSTTRSRPVVSAAGAHEWISPFGDGCLELREDWTFCLSLTRERGSEPLRIRGTWNHPPGADLSQVDLRVRDVQPSDDQAASTWLHAGTVIMVIFGKDSAIYLGLDGYVDLNWGM